MPRTAPSTHLPIRAEPGAEPTVASRPWRQRGPTSAVARCSPLLPAVSLTTSWRATRPGAAHGVAARAATAKVYRVSGLVDPTGDGLCGGRTSAHRKRARGAAK